MKLKEAHPSQLATPYERACATLARIARADTIFGRARALVLARRMERRKGSQVPANEIVGAVYSASNRSCGEWGAYECPECGQAWLGTEAAFRCCSQIDESVENFELACTREVAKGIRLRQDYPKENASACPQ